ncbi:Oxygen-dependent choline dehydrogenase [Madurella mycetomatis]|uniref:Oxygen-dependent choline dehydrogenase n=1 Tax=Madurella mycetomatis TaxID=100816 RepID=A0A175VS56_9PEZI|nr:Oxygen-dependent choline dehydrogenase [Madurella mycetomatis]
MAPGIFGSMYGDLEYHWEYWNVPQKHLNNRSHAVMAGKGLGGGSAINFLFWTHTSRRTIDDWGNLGNKGWSWDELQPYLRKSEAFIAPSTQTEDDLNITFIDPPVHGLNGPIVNSFPQLYGPLLEAWPRTYAALGLGADGDPRGGRALGAFINPFSIDPGTNERSYPASAYYLPAKARPNLKVVTGALVTKVHLVKKHPSGALTATSVSYEKSGANYIARARTEVIISAGGLESPKLLQLSGIGSRKLLENMGIKDLVDNPNVGENYQNHIMLPLGFAVNPGLTTSEDFLNTTVFQAALDEYVATRTGPFTVVNASTALLSLTQIGGSLSNVRGVKSPSDRDNSASTIPGFQEQHAMLWRSLAANEPAVQEVFLAGGMSPWFYDDNSKLISSPADGGHYYTLLGALQLPFSRGSVKIQSRDPKKPPRLDPRYLSHPVDREIARAIAFHMQKVASTAPLSDLLRGNGTVFQPGYYKLTEENVDAFIRELALPAYHHAGACSMMPKQKGGVVDERFRVHGTRGLRIVDASVLPLLPQGTINSAVIAVAERAADLIKKDYGF